MAKRKAKTTKARDWNNGMVDKLASKIERLASFDKLHRAALKADTGFIRATAQCIEDMLHDFADLVDEADAARKRGELPPID